MKYYKPKTKKGKIILMQHGFMGSANTFSGFENNLRNSNYYATFTVYDIPAINKKNVKTFAINGHTYIKELTNVENLEEWAIKFNEFYKLNHQKDIYISTEFSSGLSSVKRQMEELKMITDIIRKNTGYSEKFNLIGHSKGGLVNLEYTMKYPNEVDKVISISTPYATGRLTKLIDDFYKVLADKNTLPIDELEGLRNITSETYLSDLRRRWNNHYKRNCLHVIAGVSIRIITKTALSFKGFIPEVGKEENYESDGVVDLDDQKGQDEKNGNILDIPKKNIVTLEKDPFVIREFKFIDTDWDKRIIDAIKTVSKTIGNIVEAAYDIKYFDAVALLLGIGTGINLLSAPFSHMNICSQQETANAVINIMFNNKWKTNLMRE